MTEASRRVRIVQGLAIATLAAITLRSAVSPHASTSTVRPTQPVKSVQLPPARPSPPPVEMTDAFAVPVLMYHRIADLTEKEKRSPLMRDLTVAPKDFETQVKYLVDNGFTFLLAQDVELALQRHTPLPRKAVVVTMDDGYQDSFAQAFPILRKYGVAATLFLVTATVDTEGHVSWDEALQMQRARFGYGSHTVHHYDLTTLPSDQLDYELRESKQVLEQKLAQPITGLAYPSGQYNKTVAAQTRAVGYLAGWKKGGGPVQPGDDPYLLPRVRVNGDTSLEEFKRAVWSGVYTLKLRAERRMARAKSNKRSGKDV